MMVRNYLSFIAILFFVVLNLLSCQSLPKEQLVGCWTDSREENIANTSEQTFRPCDYKIFPPSRFRFRFQLNTDGSCQYLTLSPNDAHKMELGTWVYNAPTKRLDLINVAGKIFRSFEIQQIKRKNLLITM